MTLEKSMEGLFLYRLEDSSIYTTIRDEIRGLDIGVLVNNVGMSYEYPEFFDKVEDSAKLVQNMIRCNVDSVAYLTQMILPGKCIHNRLKKLDMK
jgi:short-subunit dehydrogenase